MATKEEAAAQGIAKILRAARSCDGRKGKLLLAADYTDFHDGLALIGASDVPQMILNSASKPSTTAPAPNVPSPNVDRLPPTEITDLTVVAAVGQIIMSCDQSADRYDTLRSIVAAGLSTYRFHDGAGTQLQSVTAPAPNVMDQGTFANISPATGSITQNPNDGNRFSLTSTGDFNDVADPISLCYYTRSADNLGALCVESIAGGGSVYAQAGLTVRESTAAGSKYLSVCIFQSGENRAVQVHGRLVTNGPYQVLASVAGINASRAYFKCVRLGNSFTLRMSWDNSPNSWFDIVNVSAAFNASLLWSAFVWGQHPSTPATATFSGFKVVPTARPSYTYPTLVATTVKALCTDLSSPANATAFTAPVTVTPLTQAPPVDNAMKFAAGLWPQLNLLVPLISDTAGWANLETQLAQAAAVPGVTGIQVILTWGVMEGDTQGDYSVGDAVFDALEALARKYGKPLFIHIWPRRFVSSGAALPSYPQTSSTRAWPNYVLNAGKVAGGLPGQFCQSAKLWERQVNDWYIAAVVHQIDRKDGSKWFHGFEPEETADFDTWQGYSYAARRTEWTHWFDSVKPHCLRSALRMSVNYFDTFDQAGIDRTAAWIEYIYQGGGDLGGPDTFATSISQQVDSTGALLARNAGDIGAALAMSTYGFAAKFNAVRDYRGLMGLSYHHEYIGQIPRATLYNHWKNVMKLTHFTLSIFNGEYQIGGADVPTTEWFYGADGLANYLTTRPAPMTANACPANRGNNCAVSWGAP